jgi:hypothetical protein
MHIKDYSSGEYKAFISFRDCTSDNRRRADKEETAVVVSGVVFAYKRL